MSDTSHNKIEGFIRLIAAALLLAVMVIVPLFCPVGFYYLGEFKWLLYSVVYILWIPLILISLAVQRLLTKNKLFNFHIRGLDLLILLYGVFCILSYVFSIDKWLAFFGYEYFRMGLFTQLTMIIGYFAAKGLWDKKSLLWYAALFTAGFIFILAVINRLGGDPFGFYEDLEIFEALTHLSTIGQHTWHSSYLSVLMPMAVAGFAFLENRRARVISCFVMVAGFAATVTQNADSGYISLAAYMLVLLWLCIGDDSLFQRFLEICGICSITFVITGILQIIFGTYIHEVDELSWFMSHSPFIYMGCIFFVSLAIVNKRKGEILKKDKRLRICRGISTLLGVALVACVIYIIFNTRGFLPEAMSSRNNYLMFADDWGNNRGVIWKAAINGFAVLDPLNKLFGAGHDCFSLPAYSMMEREIMEYFPGNIVVNAHNEWLNTLVNMGILGLISYGAIFVFSFKRFVGAGRTPSYNSDDFGIDITGTSSLDSVRPGGTAGGESIGTLKPGGSVDGERFNKPEAGIPSGECKSAVPVSRFFMEEDMKTAIIKGTAMAIASYAAHNIFCYQLIVSTPILFIFIGMSEALLKSRPAHTEKSE